MALSFKTTKGKATSNKVDTYEYKDGENRVRLVGGVLPRYVYWVKGTNNKDIPIECLAFDREKEKFTNAETDHVPAYHPDKKCTWSYAVNCIDPADSKVKVLNLKKKLFEQIIDTAADLGDPTDFDTGWTVVFKREKTGPLPFNVSYSLQVLRCKVTPLTAEERAAAEAAQDIDSKFVRQTPDEQKALLEKLAKGSSDDEETPEEAKDL